MSDFRDWPHASWKLGIRSLLCMVPLFAAHPALADFWVAVAVNKAAGQHGNSYFLDTRSGAVASALENCTNFSNGAAGCEVVVVTKRCSGMAHAGPNIYVVEDRTANRAGQNALAMCEANHGSSCRIHETFCPNQQ